MCPNTWLCKKKKTIARWQILRKCIYVAYIYTLVASVVSHQCSKKVFQASSISSQCTHKRKSHKKFLGTSKTTKHISCNNIMCGIYIYTHKYVMLSIRHKVYQPHCPQTEHGRPSRVEGCRPLLVISHSIHWICSRGQGAAEKHNKSNLTWLWLTQHTLNCISTH